MRNRETDFRSAPIIYNSIKKPVSVINSEIQYTDSTDYLLGGALTLKNGRIDKFQFEEGYCQAEKYNATQDNFTFCYYDQDHLGNIRQVTKADGSTKGKIIQKMHYYPFGAQLCDGTTDSNVQSHKYNGKEYDRMHGLNTYDYGARQYNPVTARWDRVDPLAEKYYDISPYAYCANNPLMFVDPTGMDPDSLEAALMAAYSYRDENSISYERALRNHNWIVNPSTIESISGLKATLFTRTTENDGISNNEYALAYAGTDFNFGNLGEILETVKDIATDVQNYFGAGMSLQQVEAIRLALKLSSQYDDLTFVGHSLGGGLAALSSMVTGKTAITFNPASVNGLPRNLGNLLHGNNYIIQYRTIGKSFGGILRIGGDPVNNFQSNTLHFSQGKVHPVYTNSYMPNHGINTFVKIFSGK